MITLALDASTYVGTAAVFDGGKMLGAGEAAMRGRDAERLFPLVLEVLREAGCGLADLGEVACGSGPGSFTSLRIAASIAKGIATGRGIAIRPVSSLALIVAGQEAGGDDRYLAALDALRGEHHVQLVERTDGVVRLLGEPTLAPTAQLEARARASQARLAGPGLAIGWLPHARGSARVDPQPPADLSSWEPDYGRKAEAQSRWEATHGRTLPV